MRPLLHMQQLSLEQRTVVCQHNAKGGGAEGILAFLVPTGQHRVALNGVHHDVGHQGQQQTLALAQEHFWWPMMVEDCCTLVWGCQQCHAFEGAIPKAPLCPIQVHAPLELVHVDFMSVESPMELNKPPPPQC